MALASVFQRLCQRNGKYRQASLGIEGSRSSTHTIKLIFWGIVNSNILSMTCIGDLVFLLYAILVWPNVLVYDDN
ncbi:hypothetical protein F383_16854 [Gossypium arboreum]|uniref:Uncharacterized protein n=1 Tax=Gossypium arboreum TaxID=29729 RepID=A0A0B0NSH9_GOSAR|nr:hypothetical protein F383_16854 [Gossypium arboreum]